MLLTAQILETHALNLPLSERAWLAEKLISSLDEDPEIETAWAEEIHRRLLEIEQGRVETLSGPETLARLKARFA